MYQRFTFWDTLIYKDTEKQSLLHFVKIGFKVKTILKNGDCDQDKKSTSHFVVSFCLLDFV